MKKFFSLLTLIAGPAERGAGGAIMPRGPNRLLAVPVTGPTVGHYQLMKIGLNSYIGPVTTLYERACDIHLPRGPGLYLNRKNGSSEFNTKAEFACMPI